MAAGHVWQKQRDRPATNRITLCCLSPRHVVPAIAHFGEPAACTPKSDEARERVGSGNSILGSVSQPVSQSGRTQPMNETALYLIQVLVSIVCQKGRLLGSAGRWPLYRRAECRLLLVLDGVVVEPQLVWRDGCHHKTCGGRSRVWPAYVHSQLGGPGRPGSPGCQAAPASDPKPVTTACAMTTACATDHSMRQYHITCCQWVMHQLRTPWLGW